MINSRLQRRPNQVWRRRRCMECQGVVTTLETVALDKSLVVKSGISSLQPFSRDKLLVSVYESCKHRKGALEAATALTQTIIARLLPLVVDASVRREDIIQAVMKTLQHFDTAAAIHYQAYHPM